MNTCVKWIKISMRNMGIIGEQRCGRDAPNIDVHGRYLCHRHYTKWLKKHNKSLSNGQGTVTTDNK